VANPASFTSLKLRYLIDDGAVFYLNGQEIYRYNMPTGTITSTTQAPTNIGDATTISAAVDIPVGLLIAAIISLRSRCIRTAPRVQTSSLA